MNSNRPWWIPEVDMRAIVVLLVFGMFAWSYGESPDDETMRGALIAAFAAAWGYYLGSSRSTTETRQQISEATEQAREATALAREVTAQSELATPDKPVPVRVEQPLDKPVPTTEATDRPRYAWER